MPIILLTALLAAFSGGSDAAPCSSKLPLIPAAGGQSVNVEALMNLSDIGSNGADAEPPFSVSPDGGLIAFVLRHADPSGNRYCSSLLVVDATSGAVRKSVTVPGGPLPMLLDSDGMEGLLGGPIKATIPLWSPNGSIIALQTEIAGNSQIEALAVDTGKWDQLTTSRMDVRDFSWSADGNSILFTARPETASAWSAIAQESVTGYHFDERWAPERADHPFPKPSPTRLFEINVATRTIRDAQSGRSDQSDRRPAEVHDLVGLRPTVVTIAQRDPKLINGPTEVRVELAAGKTVTCRDLLCADVEAAWWDERAGDAFFLRRTGWADSVTELYRWKPSRRGHPRRLLRTNDLVEGCRSAAHAQICLLEGSRQPRIFVMIGTRSGKMRTLFDPNPQWRSYSIGSVRRLQWTNKLGLPAYGDLVLPPDWNGRGRLPLVIIGYSTRGFLRGGTGDEYPIFPLAAHGFAVLSYTTPKDSGLLQPAQSWNDAIRRHFENFSDRDSVASAIDVVVKRLISQGIADRARIGLTGFSSGAEDARYYTIHYAQPAALILSTCCDDPVALRTVLGPAKAAKAQLWNLPTFDYGNLTETKRYSIAANATAITTPILFELASQEYTFGLEAFNALKSAGDVVDMYVYPDEAHMKSQPAHRLAIYQRNMAWLDLWLKGEDHSFPILQPDVDRWKSLTREADIRRSGFK